MQQRVHLGNLLQPAPVPNTCAALVHPCAQRVGMTKMLQVRDVPDDVHAELRRRAAAAGMSLSDFTLQELARLASRPTVADLFDRAAARAGEPMTFAEARQAVLAGRRANDRRRRVDRRRVIAQHQWCRGSCPRAQSVRENIAQATARSSPPVPRTIATSSQAGTAQPDQLSPTVKLPSAPCPGR